jgi:hypothetical protein
MQTIICAECATSGISQELRVINGEVRCTCCALVAPLGIEARGYGESKDDLRARAFAAIEAATVPPVEPEPVEVEAPAVKKARCPHYAAIKAFFAVARELGFDTSKASQDRWRGAMGMLLGRPVASRSELTGAEWGFATNALRMGKLFI